MANENVLSKRYATKEINDIFSEEGRILAEREFWIAVMKAQKELGLNIPAEQIIKFEEAKANIDLDLIIRIEQKTKHDVKAKIEAFIIAANGEEYLHWGLTSRDLTDNVEQMQYKKASEIVFGKYIAILSKFLGKAKEYENIVLTARTHHQAAQPTLVGRRFSMWAEELLYHLKNFEDFIKRYPLRGIKGPVGTQFDMLNILGTKEKVDLLEKKVSSYLGFNKVLFSTGQIYPRSLDYALTSNLSLLSAACENFANGMRLMSGYELVTEGFKEGQVGSSAMPHKMNTRSCERIWGLAEILKTYDNGASRMSGNQWEEGDVSDSAPRRIFNPDSFYTSDGICETTLYVLKNMGVYPAVIDKETDRYLPFMATTEILTIALNAGIGRETAHKIIRKYSISEALRMREEGSKKNNLSCLLAKDTVFSEKGITQEKIESILKDKEHFIGNARNQINLIINDSEELISKYSKEAQYIGKDIL